MDIWIVSALDIMNNVVKNIYVQILVFPFLLNTCLRVELLGHIVTLFHNLRNCQTVAAQFDIPTKSV